MLAIEWEEGLNDAWARIATYVPKLLGFFAILIIGYFLAKALAKAAKQSPQIVLEPDVDRRCLPRGETSGRLRP